ncbi:SDR family oxidoreductase [Streptomyces sp. NPDC017529]|uniref:SDR family oxidoreductase n=1 Tax=Streptomyces sp. NPDC017529 TaxID=3365000 RepID=UPI0037930C0D
MSPAARRVAVVGRGLIGTALARTLRLADAEVYTVARSGSSTPEHAPCDLGTPEGRAGLLAALRRWNPDRVVLTHGPSDVTWMADHPAEAAAAHTEVAEAVAARHGRGVLLVSTDNVFSGTAGLRTPDDPADPANVYGEVKLAAERAVLAAGGAVTRVSLVYGQWSTGRQRVTFAERCLDAALAGRPLSVPEDQWFTPVHIDDVADVLAAQSTRDGDTAPGRPAHLSGPAELSRHDFARAAYRLAGADEGLVTACRRADSEWATRPRYSSLRCDDFGAVTGVPDWRARSVPAGLRAMLAAAGHRASAPREEAAAR